MGLRRHRSERDRGQIYLTGRVGEGMPGGTPRPVGWAAP
ncbi:hypothetical protein I553_3357 [Mycobacterium xenopi 4042]|uniref:Uncharacterized protein n=1 Tax=Mycobacterium xenopi 4042 TaxID=1299334 RepID=X7YV42_MYCXE|nr:hypothetical protein I553_3357 [Mycobacterium xenopi 4042]